MILSSRILKLHPTILVLVGLIFAISTGVLKLILPISTTNGDIAWMETFFLPPFRLFMSKELVPGFVGPTSKFCE